MASSVKPCFFLFFFLTITLSSHQILARDSQFFNKVPSSNNNGVTEFSEPNKQPLNKLQEEEPNFIPENENNNGYGLFGHESGQLPPSTTTNDNGVRDSFRPANAKYLPKNYNTEAYVTEPEGYTPSTTTTAGAVVPENHNNYNPFSIPNSKYLPKNYNTESYVTEAEGYTPTTATQEYNNQNYYNNGYQNEQQQEYPTGANVNNNNYYGNSNRQQQSYNTGANNNNYNSLAQREYTTAAQGGSNNYDHYTNGGVNSNNGYQRQGMSDTRFLENGKYFYDVNLEKSTFNPNDVNTREFGYDNNRGYYNNNNKMNMNMNNYEYNSNQNYAGFQNSHNQFQNFQEEEEDLPWAIPELIIKWAARLFT